VRGPSSNEGGHTTGMAHAAATAQSAPSKKMIIPVVDPVESAKTAGLRYVTGEDRGIRRQCAGKGFVYIGPGGRTVHDPDNLRRIKALAIPPAWRDVWICPDPRGHLQATGRDAKGRKQYRYH